MEAIDPFAVQDEGQLAPEEGPGPLFTISPGVSAQEASEALQQFAQAMKQEEPKTYLDHLKTVADSDVKSLEKAQRSYGDSWKRRGGVGAFMMLARKWDRLENAMVGPLNGDKYAPEYDIFRRTEEDARAEGLIDDIRDLRRYLMLVEAEMIARGHGRDEVKK